MSHSLITRLQQGLIVVIAALAMVATFPGRTHGLGIVTERILLDPAFELDRIGYSNINFWATIIGGLFCLPCGWLIDKYGLRWLLSGTVLLLAATVIWMAQVRDYWSLVIAIILTRGFGQSALSIISITMVAKWFSGKLSLPMAIYALLMSFGFAYAAQIAKPWADADWRIVWQGIGFILLAFFPLALILTSDPKLQATDINQTEEAKSTSGYTLAGALSTSTFWVFALGISLVSLLGAGLSLFQESVLSQQGFPKQRFYDLITFIGVVGIVVKLPIGWLGTKMSSPLLWGVALILQAICLCAFPWVTNDYALWTYGVGMGISGTITTILFFSIWGDAFGRKHLGQIQSFTQMLTVIASACGPRLFAESQEQYGSYTPIFFLLAAMAFALGIWSLLLQELPLTRCHPQNSTLIQPQLERLKS